jgi:hypothetical protein
MLGWIAFAITKSFFYSGLHYNYYMLLYVLRFVNRDSFLDYRFELIHMSIYCYTKKLK